MRRYHAAMPLSSALSSRRELQPFTFDPCRMSPRGIGTQHSACSGSATHHAHAPHPPVRTPCGPAVCSACSGHTTPRLSATALAPHQAVQNDSTQRRHLPSFMCWDASLISSNFILCVTYLSSMVSPAWYFFTRPGTSLRLL